MTDSRGCKQSESAPYPALRIALSLAALFLHIRIVVGIQVEAFK